MPNAAQGRVTRLLEEAQQGRREAVGELLEAVYDELHAVAERKMRLEKPGNLLQPTALVNETYLRLFGENPASLSGRQHFFSVASSAMRRILIDMSRAERASKRGGQQQQVELEDWMQVSVEQPDLQIDLQRAIDALAEIDPRGGQVLQLALFGGRNAVEIAELLGVTRRTVERDLTSGRLFLKRQLQSHAANS